VREGKEGKEGTTTTKKGKKYMQKINRYLILA
jgi:hypothetical protein